MGGGGWGGGQIPRREKKRTLRETEQFSSMLLYVHKDGGLLGTGNPRMATSTFTQLLSSEDRKRKSLKVYHQHKGFLLLRSPACVFLRYFVRPERVGSQREANVLRPQFDGHGFFLCDG